MIQCRINKEGLFEYDSGRKRWTSGDIFCDILNVDRQHYENNGKLLSDLVILIKTEELKVQLILRYTSIEARILMNCLASIANADDVCYKNVRITILRDDEHRDIRVEQNGKRIRWKYDVMPDVEKGADGSLDYSKRDEAWDNVYDEISGEWCDYIGE